MDQSGVKPRIKCR